MSEAFLIKYTMLDFIWAHFDSIACVALFTKGGIGNPMAGEVDRWLLKIDVHCAMLVKIDVVYVIN